MPRYLVQIDTTRSAQVDSGLRALNLAPVSKVFDYYTVEVPDELVARVQAIPGVIAVTPEKTRRMAALVPVEMKLAEFQRLLSCNPLSAFRFSQEADAGKTRWPTSESRKMVGADVAEADGITGRGIKVAVLDSGGSIGVQGRYSGPSFVDGQPLSIDEVGHSTHVCTTMTGSPFPSIHGLLKGVAPDAQVRATKVLNYAGVGTDSDILQGLQDAVEWGADVLNLSLSGDEEEAGSPFDRVISTLVARGIIVVAAAGNAGPSPGIGSPGAEEDCLTVGAVDRDGSVCDFSGRGPTADGRIKPDVMAPGEFILSTSSGLVALMQWFDGPPLLAAISGSSMSAPHASGAVALALEYARSKGKTLTTGGIKEAMALYGGEKRTDVGWGLITYSILKRYVDRSADG